MIMPLAVLSAFTLCLVLPMPTAADMENMSKLPQNDAPTIDCMAWLMLLASSPENSRRTSLARRKLVTYSGMRKRLPVSPPMADFSSFSVRGPGET